MNQGRIIVITGAPGTGKTTTASVVAKESDLEKSVHMHTDDFYHYLSKGAIHEQKYDRCREHPAQQPQLLSGECRPEPDGAEHCFLQRGSEAGLSYGL